MKEDFIGKDFMDDKLIRYSPSPFIVDGSVIGVPFNLEDVVNIIGKTFIPNELGIYHLFYEDRLVYIGMSRNLRGRLIGHLRDDNMPFNNCLWFTASLFNMNLADILDMERKMIKKFKPGLNTQHLNSY